MLARMAPPFRLSKPPSRMPPTNGEKPVLPATGILKRSNDEGRSIPEVVRDVREVPHSTVKPWGPAASPPAPYRVG